MKLLAIICSLLIAACGHTPSEFETRVLADRKVKDDQFKGKTSPLSKEERKAFTGLVYYPYSENFNVIAQMEEYPIKEKIIMPTTKGLKKQYTKWAKLRFEINGEKYELELLKMVTRQFTAYFLPFKDNTTGDETYYTGRYMEVEPVGNTVRLDFNTAYNPWCNYSEKYNCPIPVSFNHLDTDIEAGEKIFPREENKAL